MELESLIQQPDARRDDAWEARLLDALLAAKVELVNDQPQAGPDGWPYLLVRTAPDGKEPFVRVVRWLAERGIGLVVNPQKMMPDYVFTFGMLWNFTHTGRFRVPAVAGGASGGQVSVELGPETVTGAPSEAYLPTQVRGLLRQFLAAQGHAEPRVLVISSADFMSVDLAFSAESLGGASGEQRDRLAAAIAWFLPLHYSLMIVSEQGMPRFHPL